ncbi:MAG TPA: response regulator [Candidatus Limnocylindria bacterium]|nr:response regulator [Candidatus Limnocylindria bacterium]
MGEQDAAHALGGRIRVVLSDDGSRSRRALQALLVDQPDIDVVGVVEDGDDALGMLRLLRPDIALLDEDMAAFGGAAVARVIATELPDTRVVVLTDAPRGSTWTRE